MLFPVPKKKPTKRLKKKQNSPFLIVLGVLCILCILYILGVCVFLHHSWNSTTIDYFYPKNTPLHIIIATHEPRFERSNGGTVCQYNLARMIDELGYPVRIKTPNDYVAHTPIFDKFYDPSFGNFEDENTVVIYCEGTRGNPLHSKKTVRWMLSELGKNVSTSNVETWGKHELVYYFNSENKFSPHNQHIFKLLTCIYIDPLYQNLEWSRNGWCHTFRKVHYHRGEVDIFHPRHSLEITKSETDFLPLFNRFEYFVSYDPLTFLNIIAALCGCVSIVYPIKGVSKQEYYKTLCIHPYLMETKEELYGVAYGNGKDEIEWARSTLPLVKKQWDAFERYQKKTVKSFLRDIEDWNRQENTIENNFYRTPP